MAIELAGASAASPVAKTSGRMKIHDAAGTAIKKTNPRVLMLGITSKPSSMRFLYSAYESSSSGSSGSELRYASDEYCVEAGWRYSTKQTLGTRKATSFLGAHLSSPADSAP